MKELDGINEYDLMREEIERTKGFTKDELKKISDFLINYDNSYKGERLN